MAEVDKVVSKNELVKRSPKPTDLIKQRSKNSFGVFKWISFGMILLRLNSLVG